MEEDYDRARWGEFVWIVSNSITAHPDTSFIKTVALSLGEDTLNNFQLWESRQSYAGIDQKVRYLLDVWRSTQGQLNFKELALAFDAQLPKTKWTNELRAQLKNHFQDALDDRRNSVWNKHEETFRNQTHIMYHGCSAQAGDEIIRNTFRISNIGVSISVIESENLPKTRDYSEASTYGDIVFKLLVYLGSIRTTDTGDEDWQEDNDSAFLPQPTTISIVKSGTEKNWIKTPEKSVVAGVTKGWNILNKDSQSKVLRCGVGHNYDTDVLLKVWQNIILPPSAYGNVLIQSHGVGVRSRIDSGYTSPSRKSEKASHDEWNEVLNLMTPDNLTNLGVLEPSFATLAQCLGKDVFHQYLRYIGRPSGAMNSPYVKLRQIIALWEAMQTDVHHMASNFVSTLEEEAQKTGVTSLNKLIARLKSITQAEAGSASYMDEPFNIHPKTPRKEERYLCVKVATDKEKRISYMRSRTKKVASLAAMDTFQLIFHLGGNIPGLNISSNDLIIISEMCLYKKTFALRRDQVSDRITKFLDNINQKQLSRGWTDIDFGEKPIDINIDEILPQVTIAIEENRNSKKTSKKRELLTRILDEFVEIFNNSS